jgi:NDP-sugar pyrophosphorylase family protein
MEQNPLSTTAVVILAGGLGTRLRPVLADRPKGLAPIGEKPFLEIQVELLRRQGARRFVFSIGHLAQQIQDHFGDGRRFGVEIDYSVEGPQLLGTGGALKLAERFFTPQAVVLNGDTFLDLGYAALLARHEEEQAAATLALARADDARRYGRVLLDPSGRCVVGFQEKGSPLSLRERVGVRGDQGGVGHYEVPEAAKSSHHGSLQQSEREGAPLAPAATPAVYCENGSSILGSPHPDPLPEGEGENWLNAGAYVIHRDLLAGLAPGEPYSLERDVFPAALCLGRKLAVLTSLQRFFDIGTPDGWRQFAEYYASLPWGAAGQSALAEPGGISCL